jgi:hypothetical protein
MSEKREAFEGVYSVVLQGPRDMVKAILFESQFPVVQIVHSPLQRLYCGAIRNESYTFRDS